MRYKLFDDDRGRKLSIYLSDEVKEFLEKIEVSDNKKITAVLKRLSSIGKINNKEQFRHEGEGIYAVKTFGIRIYGWFQDYNTKAFFGSNSIKKKKTKADPVDLEKAKRMRDRFQKGNDYVDNPQ